MARRGGKRQRTGGRLSIGRLAFPFAAAVVGVLIFGAGWMVVPDWFAPDVPGTAPTTATVITDVLNVRSSPGTDSAILGALTEGADVEVIGEADGGFVPIRYGEGYGWLAADYLAFDGAEPLAAAYAPVQDAVAAELPEEPVEAVAPVEVVIDEDPEPEQDVQAPVVDAVAAAPAERWIDIDRSSATVTLFEDDIAIASFQGKIGRDPASDGFYSTAIGTFHVYSMNKGLSPTPFAEDTYLTDWVGFDPVRKNGIHSPVRDRDGNEKAWQNPATLGCVRLEAVAAETVFDFAEIGMRVEVHD